MIGAVATDTNVPLGIRTGKAEANSVSSVQNARPARLVALVAGSATEISARKPNGKLPPAKTRLVPASARALSVTSPAM